MERERRLQQLRALILDAIGGEPARVVLFGSWARGDEVQSSDVDVAIESRPGGDPGLVARVREAVEESPFPYVVDVVDMKDAGLRLREEIQKEGVVWAA